MNLSFQDRFDAERGEVGWNEIPLTTLTRGTLDDWLMVTVLGWYVCAPVSFYLCVLRAFRAKTPRGRTDTRFPTGVVSTSGCRKNGFQRGAGFFRRPDGCLFSFLFFPPWNPSLFISTTISNRNIRLYTGFSKRFHVFLPSSTGDSRFHLSNFIVFFYVAVYSIRLVSSYDYLFSLTIEELKILFS